MHEVSDPRQLRLLRQNMQYWGKKVVVVGYGRKREEVFLEGLISNSHYHHHPRLNQME